VAVAESGALKKYKVEMIGASLDVIHKAEDREKFRHAMENIGLRVPKSGFARSMSDVLKIADEIGFPLIIRPSFTLGGTGSGVAYNREELMEVAKGGLAASMISEVMIEESVLGWKEYELEVMRDKADNVVIICSIENFDAMGVHTGESITVAPAHDPRPIKEISKSCATPPLPSCAKSASRRGGLMFSSRFIRKRAK